MAYIQIDTSIPRSQKFLQAGPAPSWLWLCGLAYCQEGLTDGFIPTEALAVLGVKNAAQLAFHLVKAGLWEAVDGGYHVRDYLMTNRSAEQVRVIREERRRSGQRGGVASGAARRSEDAQPVKLGAEARAVATGEAVAEANPQQALKPVTVTVTVQQQNKEQEGCSEPLRDSEPALLSFPTIGIGSKSWPLTQTLISAWSGAYPGVDVMAECRRALAWVDANTSNRKTARGMPAFLVRWLNKSVDRGHGQAQMPLNGRGRTGAPVGGKYAGIEES